jgi:hypothetical protein
VLKKAGIIVAASAATLLAVSPLAFAGDKGGDRGHWDHHRDHDGGPQVNAVDSGSHSSGLVAIGDINALNNLNVCPELPVTVNLGNLLGILGTGTAAGAPVMGDATCVAGNSVGQGNKH